MQLEKHGEYARIAHTANERNRHFMNSPKSRALEPHSSSPDDNREAINAHYRKRATESAHPNPSPKGAVQRKTSASGAATKLTSNGQKFFKKERPNQRISPIEARFSGKLPRPDTHKSQQPQIQANFQPQPFVERPQYQYLHQCLNRIQQKITEMKAAIQRKKQQKAKQADKPRERRAEAPESVSLTSLVTSVPETAHHNVLHENPYADPDSMYYVSELVKYVHDQRSLVREHISTSLFVMRKLEDARAPSVDEAAKRQMTFPKRRGYQNKKTVVFDLDETLIHCNETHTMPCDVKLQIRFPTGELIDAGINIRPYAHEILRNLNQDFQVVVFTASHPCYANVVLDYLDPTGELIHHRLFRDQCYCLAEGRYIKDLRIMDRDLSQVVLIDNAAYSYIFQLDNGIPIVSFYDNKDDYELFGLEKYLKTLQNVPDVRSVNKNMFKLDKYMQYGEDAETLVEELYYPLVYNRSDL